MLGIGNNLFAPETSLSRAMIATMLWRLEGSPIVSTQTTFTDVQSGTWYTDAVNWAQSVGVIKGYNNCYKPMDDVTRQELATILRRYAEYKGMTVTNFADISAFPDANKVSDWAEDGVKWANKTGIIQGKGDGTLGPQASTLRTEAACMFQRFCELFSTSK